MVAITKNFRISYYLPTLTNTNKNINFNKILTETLYNIFKESMSGLIYAENQNRKSWLKRGITCWRSQTILFGGCLQR